MQPFIRFFLLPCTCTLFALVLMPTSLAGTPSNDEAQVAAIPLTTELLDKIQKFGEVMDADTAAKAELAAAFAAARNEPGGFADLGATINAKCPKVVEVSKIAGLTIDELLKAMDAMMTLTTNAAALAKSANNIVKANVDFFTANKNRVLGMLQGLLAFFPSEEDEKYGEVVQTQDDVQLWMKGGGPKLIYTLYNLRPTVVRVFWTEGLSDVVRSTRVDAGAFVPVKGKSPVIKRVADIAPNR